MSRFEYYYQNILRYDLIVKHNYTNCKQIPKIKAVHFHLTNKDALNNSKNIFSSLLALEMITGQKAQTVKAKHSLSTFKLRKGATIACHVTLRHPSTTYPALEKLLSSVLTKEDREILLRGWKGDTSGNASFGITDCFSYKELEDDYEKFAQAVKGLQVTVTFSSQKGDTEAAQGCKNILCGLQFALKK